MAKSLHPLKVGDRGGMKRRIHLIFIGLILTVTSLFFVNMSSSYSRQSVVAMTSQGKLAYRKYANINDSLVVNRLPDFSYAGYRGGGVSLPVLPVKITLEPSTGDASARIQAALNSVSELPLDASGFRGAVLLKKGFYAISKPLYIRASGVVLRGEGQDPNGTVIVATTTQPISVITLMGQGSGLGEIKKTRTQILDELVPVGANQFYVENSSIFAMGDTITVRRTVNDDWISAIGMDRINESNEVDADWSAKGFDINHERVITKINKNLIEVDIPLVDTIDSRFGGGVVYKANPKGRISEVGVENLRIVSNYKHVTDENHARIGITVNRVLNGWVKEVTVQNLSHTAVTVTGYSKFITVQDSAMLEPISRIIGGSRYSFNVGASLGVLFQRCYSDGGRHSFVSGSRVTGPHVWVDSLAVNNHSDDGPHHRWATGLLYDNVQGGVLAVQNRLDWGTGQGWSGAQIMFWRSKYDKIILNAPTGSMNWAVAMEGRFIPSNKTPNEAEGIIQADHPSLPRSLYFQQLQDRLGEQAVHQVTTEDQRNGKQFDVIKLLTRAPASVSDPACASGIRSGSACCPLACGTCGGINCSARPGGAAACCTIAIKQSAVSCLDSKAPCNIPGEKEMGKFAKVQADPSCSRGIKSDNGACCAAGCGKCGGTGCSGLPGGVGACCTGAILEKAKSCALSEAPCVLPDGL